MASRAEQKAALRAQREATQRAHAAAQSRRMRLIYLAGIVGVVLVGLVVVILASSSGGGGNKSNTPAQAKAAKAVDTLLAGIPETGTTIGKPSAPVTITEYGDLECPICDEFALGSEKQLIASDVRVGQVKLVYRSLETASSDPNVPSDAFGLQQVAAYAAGKQDKAWYYILDFYDDQRPENTPYVTSQFLQGIATQVPGLKLTKWQSDRNDPALSNQVAADGQAAQAAGFDFTPAIVVSGPKGAVNYDPQTEASGTVPTLLELQQLITQVG